MTKYITIAFLMLSLIACQQSTKPQADIKSDYQCVNVYWIDTLSQPFDTTQSVSTCQGKDTTIYKYLGSQCKAQHIMCEY